jgi:hypothetical protein
LIVHVGPLLGTGNVLTPFIACDHCGLIALDTPEFGWKRWHSTAHLSLAEVMDDETRKAKAILMHHCPAAVEYNDLVSRGLVYNVASEDAVTYEDWEDAYF